MPLEFRPATPTDYPVLEKMVIDSFEPITWFTKIDRQYGALNGHTWRERWQRRFAQAFATQTVLIGEAEGEIVAYASGTLDVYAKLGFIDLLAVDRRFQGHGYGREMLRGMLRYMKTQGMAHCHLECLTDNDTGNALYRSEGFAEVARSNHWFIRIP